MNIINISSFFTQSHALQNKMQEIYSALQLPFSSKEQASRLEERLNEASQSLKKMKDQWALQPKLQDECTKFTLQLSSLHHRFIEAWVKKELAQIQKEAAEVDISIREGRDSARAAYILRTHIHAFKQEYQPSIPERRILSEALNIANQALCPNPTQNRRSVPQDFMPFPGEIEELMSIAYLVYKKEMMKATQQFRALPPEKQEAVTNHLQELGVETPLFSDPIPTMQALLAHVNDLVGNQESYPSETEIDDLFIGWEASASLMPS